MSGNLSHYLQTNTHILNPLRLSDNSRNKLTFSPVVLPFTRVFGAIFVHHGSFTRAHIILEGAFVDAAIGKFILCRCIVVEMQANETSKQTNPSLIEDKNSSHERNHQQ
jgi:hypothetical protein